MTNFDIAQESLQTSLASEGSAMREHEKWMESLQAKINQLKAAWQGFSQAFMSSDFLKGALDTLIKILEVLTKMIDTVGVIPTLLTGFVTFKGMFGKNGGLLDGLFNFDKQAGQFKVLGKSMGEYRKEATRTSAVQAVFGSNLNKTNPFISKSSSLFGTLTKSISGTAIKTAALSVGASLLQGGIIALASVAISFAIKKFDEWYESADELSERIDKLTSDYQSQHSELVKGKSDFESTASTYAKLSKGVDGLGRNVSLTADEYAEYQSVVNSIAEQVPSLVAGYDSQGNAILNCAGNVNELTAAYEELIKTQNNKILLDAKDIEEDFSNEIESLNKKGKMNDKLTTDTSNAFEEILNNAYSADEIADYFENNASKTGLGITEMVNAIKDAGIEVLDENGEVFDLGVLWSRDTGYEYVAAACEQNGDAVRAIVNDFNTTLEAETEGMKSIAEATLSNAFDISDSKYADMSDTLQSVAKQVVSSFDYDFYAGLQTSGQSVEDYIHGMLDEFDKLHENDVNDIEAIFNLQTKFNNGDVSYGEYVSGIKEAEEVINSLDLDDEVKSQIKLALNTEEITNEYETLQNRLEKIVKSSGGETRVRGKKIEEFLSGLSAEELSVALDLVPELDEDATLEEIQSAINREMAIRGLVFDLDIEVEAAGIDAVNTALAETVSATGLSSESIAALKGRYAELEEDGYNLSSMFEETSNGIHLNREAFSELEQAYAKGKLKDVKKDLTTLYTEYDNLTKEIDSCTDASERASLYSQRDAILQQINDCATLASQYEGLASAYNAWINAESAGQERDMYENIIEGFENIEDEISRGWLDDGTIKFLELLTGETDLASKSGKELKEVYESLDDTIKNTSYSVSDFFTVDDDGNSTNAGVYNFLDAIHQLEKTDAFKNIEGIEKLVKKDADGNIVSFDFELVAEKDENGNVIKNGDQVIAEALGISEELVQIMVRAADDAGFVVNLEGAYTQLADLKTEAESARDSLISLKKEGNLKDITGKAINTDVNFNFDAEGEDLVTEQEKAVKLLDKFKKDGKIDLEMTGAQDALDIAEYLTIKLDDLTEPKFMQIDTSEVDEDLRDPIEKIQEIGQLCKEKHLVTLTGDTKELNEVQGEIDKVAKEIEKLDPEVKAQIGVDEDWNAKTIADKVEKGEIEIPAELELDVQMSDDLKDMRLMMMKQLGLASDNEIKLKVGYDIDESIVDSLSEEQKEVIVKYIAENEEEFNKLTEEEKEILIKYIAENEDEFNDMTEEEKEVFIKYIADGGDIEKFDEYIDKEKNIKIIAETFGEEDVEGLSEALKGVDSTKVQAVAEALGKKDVDELDKAIAGMEDNEATALAHALGYEDVEELKKSITDMKGNEVDAFVNTEGQAGKITTLQSEIDGLEGKKVNIWLGIKKIASSLWSFVTDSGGSKRSFAGGTANVDGTAFAQGTTGRAYKQGDWSAKDSGEALGGELGRETIVRNGRYFTIGDNGAEFFQYKKGDIIFNHKQTEELFKNGKVTSGGGRAKALVGGTAFAEGTAFSSGTGGIGKVGGKAVEVKADTVNVTSKSSTTKSTSKSSSSSKKSTTKKSSSKKSSSSSTDEFEETFDWIEIAIDRIERAIDQLDLKANSIYKKWSTRNSALVDEIGKVEDEISLQQKAYDRYIKEANSVGLSSSYAKLVREGKIDISTITNESLAEKISEYTDWYNKALDCKDAIEELKEKEAELYKQRFENVSTQYEGILGVVEHEKNMLEEFMAQSEANAQLTSSKYYDALIKNEQTTISKLQSEKSALLSQLNTAVASGKIKKESEAWYEMVNSIDEVTLAIEESNTAILEYQQTLQQLSWETFDLLQDKISSVSEEAEFLIELLSSDKLYDDKGQLTDSGSATMGLYGVAYNTSMYQADKAGAEAARLKKELAKDPFDTELEERYREMVSLQQEYIQNANDMKEAIRDMVEEGIELELDSLNELIDKYNEALDSEKDLYDYQRDVTEQTQNIANLRKQLLSYEGDNSEEAQAKIQELRVSLAEAESDLEETEYDKFISDSEALLDSLYLEYETILNTRLDNIDALLESMISEINTDASSISTIISDKADSVGYTLTDSMSTIWDTNSTKINSVITTYGDKFTVAQTTTNTALNTINTNLQNMITQLNSIAKTKVKSANTSSAAGSKEASGSKSTSSSTKKTTTTTKKTTTKSTAKAIKKGGKINAKGADIYDYAGDKSGEHQYYYKDPIYKVLKTSGNWLQVRWHKLSKGITGWFKKGDVKAYKTGTRRILNNEFAWTQEAGKEFIVRPSDGAILTPLAKNDSVLDANASGNIWNMANSPSEFIKENLGLDASGIPNNLNTQNTYTQNLDKVVFNLPNVKNYEELLTAMQKDKNFEKLILSMSIDRLAGKSALGKNKAIR